MNINKLNPEIEVTVRGKLTRVEYIQDYFYTTGLFDHREGRQIYRLKAKLTREEWLAVSKYFQTVKGKKFRWGTSKPEIVISTLVKIRRPEIDRVVTRNKITEKGVKALIENKANVKCGITGVYLLPHGDDESILKEGEF